MRRGSTTNTDPPPTPSPNPSPNPDPNPEPGTRRGSTLCDLQTQQGALYGGVRVVNGSLSTRS